MPEIKVDAEEMLQQLCSMTQNIPTAKKWQDFYSGFIDLNLNIY